MTSGEGKTYLLGTGALLSVVGRIKVPTATGQSLRLLAPVGVGPGVYLRLSNLWGNGPAVLHAGMSVAPLKRQRSYSTCPDVLVFVSAGTDRHTALDTNELLALEFWACASAVSAARHFPALLACDNKLDRDGGLDATAARRQREPVLAALAQQQLLQMHPALNHFLEAAASLVDVTSADVRARVPAACPVGDTRRSRQDLALIVQSGLLPAGTRLAAFANGSSMPLELQSDGWLLNPVSGERYESPSSVCTWLIRQSRATSTRRNGWQSVVVAEPHPYSGRTLHWARGVARCLAAAGQTPSTP